MEIIVSKVVLVLIVIIISLVTSSLLKIVHDRKVEAWEQKYKELWNDVENSSVTIANFIQLAERFIELRGMPGFNEKKYQVLKDRFLNRFCKTYSYDKR